MALGEIVRIESQGRFVFKASDDDGVKPEIGTYVRVGDVIGLVVDKRQSVREELIPYIPTEMSGKYLPYGDDLSENYFGVASLGMLSGAGPDHEAMVSVSLKDAVDEVGQEDLMRFHTVDGRFKARYIDRLVPEVGPTPMLLATRRLQNVMGDDNAPMILAVQRYLRGLVR